MKFRFVFSLVLLFILYCSTQAQTWKAVNDENLYIAIHKIYFPIDNDDKIIIASDNIPMDLSEKEVKFYDHYTTINGKGYQMSTDRGSTFSKGYLDTWFVYAFAQDPNNTNLWLAAIRNNGNGNIVISEDGGNIWNLNDLRVPSTSQIVDIAVKNSKPARFFTSSINKSDGFKTSIDTFRTFTKASDLQISSRDIEISPVDSSLIFIAGDKLHNGGVYRSRDNGQTWIKFSSGLENLRIHTVMPSAYDPSIVVCGADSLTANGSVGKGIYVSLDTGRTWNLNAAKNSRVFQIVRHPSNPRFMAAACDTSGVWLSGCWGTGWEHFDDGFPDSASIRCVGLPNWAENNDGIIVYAGTYSSGLWVTPNRIKTSVEEISENFSKITFLTTAPSPFNQSVSITWFNPKAQKLNVEIKDINGNAIHSFNESVYNQGINNITWTPDAKIAGGSYFVVVSDGFNNVSEKIIFIK